MTARDLLDDVASDGVTGGHRLQATEATTATARAAGADRRVADLPGPTVGPVIQLTIDHESATDA